MPWLTRDEADELGGEWKAATDYRSADNWREALEKQAVLMSFESGPLDPNDPNDPGRWFADASAACSRAVALWDEQSAGDEEARCREVGRLLAEESAAVGWQYVASTLKDAANLDPSIWLDW